jgi:pimeloyl-ACP methyl ester carboxylesterase
MPYACFLRAPEQPFGLPVSALPNYLEVFGRNAGTGAVLDLLAPSWSDDVTKRRWWARGERLAGGPGDFMYQFEIFARTDIRPVLGSIQAPTLVLSRRDDRHARRGHAEAIAQRIPRAAGRVRRRRQRVVRR